MAQPERRPEEQEPKEKPYLRVVDPNEKAETAAPRSGLAIAGFSLSLASLMIFGVFLGPMSIALSLLGLSEINLGKRSGEGLAVTGVVVGTVSFIFSLIYLILVFSDKISSASAFESGMVQRLGLF